MKGDERENYTVRIKMLGLKSKKSEKKQEKVKKMLLGLFINP